MPGSMHKRCDKQDQYKKTRFLQKIHIKIEMK